MKRHSNSKTLAAKHHSYIIMINKSTNRFFLSLPICLLATLRLLPSVSIDMVCRKLEAVNYDCTHIDSLSKKRNCVVDAMIKLLVIADDFTGALDAGVKFFGAGASTKVITDIETDFMTVTEDVLVLCAPTRHLPPQEAYEMIRGIVEKAVASNVGTIYKKTDSALRGNIGAELNAVLDGSGEKHISFIPALPAMNRITLDGVHFIDGIPVAQSVFGQDPFDPVTESYIPALLHQQCRVAVKTIGCTEALVSDEEPCISVFDCSSYDDMEKQVQKLKQNNRLKVLAGCAGFASILPAYLGLTRDSASEHPSSAEPMTVICGSVSPISCSQMDYAESQGYSRVHIPTDTLLSTESLQQGESKQVMDLLWHHYTNFRGLIIDSIQPGGESVVKSTSELSLEDIRKKIARRMGNILKDLLERGAQSRIMVIGGDTLLAFLEAICCTELKIVSELLPGVVLSKIIYMGREYEIVSKSGGFGSYDLLVKLGIPSPIHTTV